MTSVGVVDWISELEGIVVAIEALLGAEAGEPQCRSEGGTIQELRKWEAPEIVRSSDMQKRGPIARILRRKAVPFGRLQGIFTTFGSCNF